MASKSRLLHVGLVTAGCILIAFLLSFIVSIRVHVCWCDSVTGSIKSQTCWPLGITTGAKVEASPLETRLHSIGYQWVPSWKFCYKTHETLWGKPTWFEDRFPPILELRPVLEQFVNSSSSDELRQFADIMQTGTDAEQDAAIARVTAAFDHK